MVSDVINVSGVVKDFLRSISLGSDESFDSILVRLLDCKVGVSCVDYLIFDDDYEVMVCIAWGSSELSLFFYDGDGGLSSSFPIGFSVSDSFYASVSGISDLSVFALLDKGEVVCVDGLFVMRL